MIAKVNQYKLLDMSRFFTSGSGRHNYFPQDRPYFPKRTGAQQRVVYLEDYAHLLECLAERCKAVGAGVNFPRSIPSLNYLECESSHWINYMTKTLLKTRADEYGHGAIIDGDKMESIFSTSEGYSDFFSSEAELNAFLRGWEYHDDSYAGENEHIEKAEAVAHWYEKLRKMGWMRLRVPGNTIQTTYTKGQCVAHGSDFDDYTWSDTDAYDMPFLHLVDSPDNPVVIGGMTYTSGTCRHSMPYDNQSGGYLQDKVMRMIVLYTYSGNKADGQLINGGNPEYRVGWVSTNSFRSPYDMTDWIARYGYPTRYSGQHKAWREAMCRIWEGQSYSTTRRLDIEAHVIGFIYKDWILTPGCNVLNYANPDYYVW